MRTRGTETHAEILGKSALKLGYIVLILAVISHNIPWF